MIKTVVCTHRTMTEQRNVASVSPKLLNVLVNPIKRHKLIHQAEISGTAIVIERHPPKDIRSILDGDDDDAFSGQVQAGNSVRSPVVGFFSSDDYDDRKSPDFDRRFRCPNVEVEAVFRRSAIATLRCIFKNVELWANGFEVTSVVRSIKWFWTFWGNKAISADRWLRVRNA